MTDILTLNIRDFDGMDMGAGHGPALVEKINELVSGVNASGDVVFPPVADLAALKAIAADDLEDKMLVLCETLGLYRYDTASAATADDVGVVAPTAVGAGAGRFLRIYKSLMPIPETGRRYVDATLGSDASGDGSINKPLASIAAAITAASAGHSIFVAPGTYTPAGGTLTVNKAVNLFMRGATVNGAVTLSAAAYVEGMITTGAVVASAAARLKDCTFGTTFEVSSANDVQVEMLTVAGAITLSAAGGIFGRDLIAGAALTSTAGAGLDIYHGSIGGAMDLSGGACNSLLFGCTLSAALTFTGTGAAQLTDCTVAGNVAAEDGSLAFRGGAIAGNLVVTGDCQCEAVDCPVGGLATLAGVVASLTLVRSPVTGAVSMAGAGDTLIADSSDFALTLALGDGTGVVELHNLTVADATTITTALASLTLRDVAFVGAVTSTNGAGLDMAGGSIGGAVNLSGGACNSILSGCALASTLTFTGTGYLRATNCAVTGAVAAEDGEVTLRGGSLAAALAVTGDCQCTLVDCPVGGTATLAGALASLSLVRSPVTGAVAMAGAGDTLLAQDSDFASTFDVNDGTASVELVRVNVAGACVIATTMTSFVCRDTAFVGVLTSTAGAGVDMTGGSVGGAVDLAGGAAGSYFSQVALGSTFDYSGTGVGRLVDCHVAGLVTCDGVNGYVYLERTGVVGLLTVDGAAAMSHVYASDCSLAAVSLLGAGGFGTFTARNCQFSGNITEDGGYAFLTDCWWSAVPVIRAQAGIVAITSTSEDESFMYAGAPLTGIPFIVDGGDLRLTGLGIEHTGDTDLFAMTINGGALQLTRCSVEGTRATALLTALAGEFFAKDCRLENSNAPDAVFADLAACTGVSLENVVLDGVLDCTGLTIDATDVRLENPGQSALLATAVNPQRQSHRMVGLLQAGRNLIAQFAGGGGAWDDAVGPFGLVGGGGNMPFPATTVGLLQTAGGAGVAFTVTGTDPAGNVISEAGTTVIGVLVSTTRAFAAITRIQAADPGGGASLDLQTGDGAFLGWDVLGVLQAALGGELDGGAGAFDVETRVWVPTTAPPVPPADPVLIQIEAAV